MGKYDRWTLTISALAFFVSVISAGFTYWQGRIASDAFQYSKDRDTIETAGIIFSDFEHDEYVRYNAAYEDEPGSISMKLNCMLTNTSGHTLSFIDCEILQKIEQNSNKDQEEKLFINILDSIYDVDENILKVPFLIEPDHAIMVCFDVNFLLEDRVNAFIQENFQNKTSINFSELKEKFADSEIKNIFGFVERAATRKVWNSTLEKIVTQRYRRTEGSIPEIIIRLESIRNNEFETLIPMDSFMLY